MKTFIGFAYEKCIHKIRIVSPLKERIFNEIIEHHFKMEKKH